jgi:hypothetical protein
MANHRHTENERKSEKDGHLRFSCSAYRIIISFERGPPVHDRGGEIDALLGAEQ